MYSRLFALVLALTACADDATESRRDAGDSRDSSVDSGARDTGARDTGARDTGARDASAIDAATDSAMRDARLADGAVTHPATCTDLECTEVGAFCIDGCALTCVEFEGRIIRQAIECSAFGRCEIMGMLAACVGTGAGDPCNPETFEARCEGNVAFSCDARGEQGVFYCERDDLCWAEGGQAGCHIEPGMCSGRLGGCGGFRTSPCCDGLTCDGSICRIPLGGECTFNLDCERGLSCRLEDGSSAVTDPGTCQTVSCATSEERCDWLGDTPCCLDGVRCVEEYGRCCVEAGVVPLVGGTVDSGLCCEPFGTNEFDECT
ncbi:MAG: hypothetical protein AAGE52_31180 [Myxococcota bacterium]